MIGESRRLVLEQLAVAVGLEWEQWVRRRLSTPPGFASHSKCNGERFFPR